MSDQRFPIRIGRRSALLLRLAFGVTSDRAWVRLASGMLTVRFGWYERTIPLATVARWRIEGPWRWITAIGVRRSVRGPGDISFAGSPRGGVRLDLSEPMRWGPLTIHVVYVGIDDLGGFAAALAALGIPGEDAFRG